MLAYRAYLALVVLHLVEHFAQLVQLHVLRWPLRQAGGLLGLLWPWLNHSETLHLAFAIIIWAGLYLLACRFRGAALWWWGAALVIQTWHLGEHLLLFMQALTGHYVGDAPQPISAVQLVGLCRGSAASGFGGLLTRQHGFEVLMVLVRRPEVHATYNLAVAVPMLIGACLRRERGDP